MYVKSILKSRWKLKFVQNVVLKSPSLNFIEEKPKNKAGVNNVKQTMIKRVLKNELKNGMKIII